MKGIEKIREYRRMREEPSHWKYLIASKVAIYFVVKKISHQISTIASFRDHNCPTRRRIWGFKKI